ncbi:MAG: Gfo/Idh/MocA family oxidoreductase [Victivallales bacterium]|nr:Gfo/Idh/MocA family oxidoreductase [Victivallales bacterium]
MALKVGVVGIRGIGNRHADCHMEDELAELVAVCDIVPSRADEAAEKHGVKAYYSLKDMLANEELDIVDVCTGGPENGGWHYEPAMEAIAAGKNVLVEKPISNDIEDAREMVAFAQEQNVYLGCNLNHYFTEPAEKAREAMDAGEIGEQVFCLHRMGFPGGERTFSPGGPPNAKGFPYFHVKAFLAHPFSIMRYFCGDITHVQAFMGQPSFRKSAGDLMVSVNSIHVQFQSGAVGYLFSQRGDATMGMGGWWSVEVGGTKGTFCIENCVEKYTFYPCPGTEGAAKPEKLGVGAAPPPTVHNTGVTDFGETFPRRIHAYLEDVTNKVPKHELRASGRDALATLEYTFAAIESFEAGGVLVRPNPLPIIKHIPAERES